MPLCRLFQFLIVMLSLQSTGFAQERLSISWEESHPYQWQDTNGQLQGLDIEIAKLILNKAGFEPEFKKMPWNRVIKSGLKSGKIDIALGASKTDERQEFAHFSHTSYAPWDSAIFILGRNKEQFKTIKTLQDVLMHDITIGVTRGSIYSEEYERLLENPNFTAKLYLAPKEDQALKMLAAGRVDAIIAAGIGTVQTLKKWQASDDIILHTYLSNSPDNTGSYLMYSKHSVSSSQADRLNKALEQLKKDGSLDKIINKYLPLIH